MIKIAINGFGRIGRSFFRIAHGMPDVEIVAINDLAGSETLAYLLKYDSVYGRYEPEVGSAAEALTVNGVAVPVIAERDPAKLPWGKLGVDIVVEATGYFASGEKSQPHLSAGAKRVVITAPAKGDNVTTALIGVNDDRFADAKPITSNASCTTNSVAPVLAILLESLGIERASMTTVHGYTATQKLVDGPDAKDLRRGRAAAVNIVPSTTGAADAAIQAIPELEGKFIAEAIRVPTITGSLSVITAATERSADVTSVQDLFRSAARDPRWEKILKATDDQLVSSDIVGEPFGAIVDVSLTRVLGWNFVKVFSWYDNEYGYSATLLEHVRRLFGSS